jgi:hypothetical protein
VTLRRLSVRAGDGWGPPQPSHAFRREGEEEGFPRLVAAPDRDHVGLLIELSRRLPEPFFILYVLLSSRCLRPPGRYQTTRPVSRDALETFLDRFRAFLEQDGRHGLWVASAEEPSNLVWDQHGLLHLVGRLEEYEPVLRAAGMDEGPVEPPGEHRHEEHEAFDARESELLGAFHWTWNPLEPGDDPLE